VIASHQLVGGRKDLLLIIELKTAAPKTEELR
jgi:hypothetical protein